MQLNFVLTAKRQWPLNLCSACQAEITLGQLTCISSHTECTCVSVCACVSWCVIVHICTFIQVQMCVLKPSCVSYKGVCVCGGGGWGGGCNPNPSDFHCVLLCSSLPFPDHLHVLEVIWARDLPPACKGSFDITVMDWSGKNIQVYKDVGKCCTVVFNISCLEILFKKLLGTSKSVLSLLPPE